jgi:nicotinamidase-related amidase
VSDHARTFEEELALLRRQFEAAGMLRRAGCGARPALLVIDMIRGFTDPASPLGADAPDAVEAIGRLLAGARAARIPVIYSTCHWLDTLEGGRVWSQKIPTQRVLQPGSEWVEVDARLPPAPGEAVIVKHHASCFFGTGLADRLRDAGVDTVIATGMTTSGCVRASVVDAVSSGFRTIVAREAVADRARLPHLASLFDMDAKYGDVMGVEEVLEELRTRTSQAAA